MEGSEASPPRVVRNVRRFFRDHEIVVFSITVLSVCLLTYLAAIHIPALIVCILLAYLIEGVVSRLEQMNCPRLFAISSTMLVCILSITLLLLVGLPKLADQVRALAEAVPASIEALRKAFDSLPPWLDEYLAWESVADDSGRWFMSAAETFVSTSLTNVSGLFSLLVYLVLIPMIIFFLLRDKDVIIGWINKFVPRSKMISALESELDEQFGAYVRGKIIEGVIIFALSLVVFLVLGVNFAFSLAVAIGLSVIIPYVGAIAVTIPVVMAGLLQFGLSPEFWWMVGAYTVIQIFDGQVLVPLLFSEVVRIHPVAILVAILLFGAIWGVWGIFFAIPLASLIKSVINVIEKQLEPAA